MLTLDNLQGLGGSQVPVRDLVELNKALQSQGLYKAGANAGYPTPMGPASGDFAPLIPQSIQSVLDSATFTESMVKFFRMLPKVPVGSTVHEAIVMNEHGSVHLDPFIAEGGKNVRSSADYARKSVQIRYLAELREITDVATMVNTIGGGAVSKQGLALETQAGTTSLLGKLERSLFWANSDLSGLHFDGIYKQLTQTTFVGTSPAIGPKVGSADENFEDLQGGALTPDKLMEGLYKVYAAPNYGTPTAILVEPRTYASLQQQAFLKARFGLDAGAPQALTLYNGQLSIAGPTGAVPIVSCPLLLPPQTPPSAAVGDSAPATPLFNDVTAVNSQAKYLGNGTNWQGLKDGAGTATTDDSADYAYKVVAVNANGHSAASAGQDVTFADANRLVEIDLNDDGVTKTNLYYRVYRTGKGGSAASSLASDYKWVMDVPAHAGAVDTMIIDDKSMIPGTAPCFILQATPDVMCWTQLLDFLRRPLAQTNTSVPFLLMLFGSPFVKVPTKNFVFANCKLGV